MTTITEDYVSFETAKLLIKKGFDFNAEYESYYTLGGVVIYFKDRTQDINIAPRITLQMAMKWLRKVHNIDISIIPLRSHKEYLPRIESDTISHDAIPCRKHEEACEAAIKYCLEHII